MRAGTSAMLGSCLLWIGGVSCQCAPELEPLDLSAALEDDEARAGRTDKAADLIGGPWADGRVGDYKIYNSRARFIVQGLDPIRSMIGFYGGHLIDADRAHAPGDHDHGHDVMVAQNEVVGLLGVEPIEIEVVNDGRDGDDAILRVVGRPRRLPLLPDGALGLGVEEDSVDLRVQRDYILPPGSELLQIRTEVFNLGELDTPSLHLGDAFNFSGHSAVFAESAGYDLLFGADDYLVATSEEISYGTSSGFGDYELLLAVQSILFALVRSAVIPAGGSALFERFISVGDGGVSGAAAPLLDLLGRPSAALGGAVNDEASGDALAGARVDVYSVSAGGERDGLLTTSLAGMDGAFRAVVPLLPGGGARAVELVASHGGRPSSAARQVEVGPGGADTAALTIGAGTILWVEVSDASSGQPLPARVDLAGTGGAFRFPIGAQRVALAVPPGTYTVTASRGFEYSYDQLVDLVLAPGTEVDAALTLSRVVDTSGYVSADLHLHSIRSVDSGLRLEDRVAALVAEGLEFVAATDHDHITDYQPTIETLTLTPWLTAVPGCEISTLVLGHFGGFPLRLSSELPANGAIPWYGMSPAEIFAAIRAQGEASVVVQVNHPRQEGSALFDAVELHQGHGHATADPESLQLPAGTDLDIFDFDVIEVFNGKRVGEMFGEGDRLGSLYDFYALLNAGRVFTMTGNSDSHELDQEPGLPRNYIRSSSDDPGALDIDALMASLRGGDNAVVGGPFLRFTAHADGADYDMGALVPAAEGVDLRIYVAAPAWVSVSSVDLIENGETIATFTRDAGDLAGDDQVVRMDTRIAMTPTRDAWYMLLARGDRRMTPVLNDLPLSFANPIFLDVDQDGRFRPPWDR